MNYKKQPFDQFYQKNIDKIYRFVFFKVNQNKDLAEDLVSEIFIKAMNNYDNFDVTISSSAWLFTIARNHLINYWRDNKKMESVSIPEDESAEDVFWLKQAILSQDKTQTRQTVYELLTKLEDKEREYVTFHYLFGYNYAEIAEMKKTSEGAVKVMVHRALKKLRSLL